MFRRMQIFIVVLVIALNWQACGPSHDVSREMSSVMGPTTLNQSSKADFIIANNQQLANMLLDIFAPPSVENLNANEAKELQWLERHLSVSFNADLTNTLGGNCDLYAFYQNPDRNENKDTDPLNDVYIRDCNEPVLKNLDGALIGRKGVSRAALKIGLCEDILSKDVIVNWMMQKTKVNLTSPSRGPAQQISGQEMTDYYYHLFYPTRPASQKLIKELNRLATEAQAKDATPTSLETTRFLLLALCQSTDWEIIE